MEWGALIVVLLLVGLPVVKHLASLLRADRTEERERERENAEWERAADEMRNPERRFFGDDEL